MCTLPPQDLIRLCVWVYECRSNHSENICVAFVCETVSTDAVYVRPLCVGRNCYVFLCIWVLRVGCLVSHSEPSDWERGSGAVGSIPTCCPGKLFFTFKVTLSGFSLHTSSVFWLILLMDRQADRILNPFTHLAWLYNVSRAVMSLIFLSFFNSILKLEFSSQFPKSKPHWTQSSFLLSRRIWPQGGKTNYLTTRQSSHKTKTF